MLYSYGCVCHYYRVPGEIKRREMELDPHVSPEEIMSMQKGGAGLRKLDFFRFRLFFKRVQRTFSS